MSWRAKVQWREDLFIRTQCLQQADRDLGNALESRPELGGARVVCLDFSADWPELQIELWVVREDQR
jgi:predicted component of type VI protein secretion system